MEIMLRSIVSFSKNKEIVMKEEMNHSTWRKTHNHSNSSKVKNTISKENIEENGTNFVSTYSKNIKNLSNNDKNDDQCEILNNFDKLHIFRNIS